MTALWGMSPDELKNMLSGWGEPAYRSGQLFRELQKGTDISDMTVLSKALRERLLEEMPAPPVRVLEEHASAQDGTVKLLYGLQDGNCVEGVLMRYHYGYSLCISTQVGCRMGCKFCASTLEGCVRSLSAGEMLGEILAANRFLAEGRQSAGNPGEAKVNSSADRVSHVVLMGSGEPLDNYDQVMRFLRLLREENGIHLSLRNVSLSTCGLVPEMRRLAEEDLPVTLCVSLHAPNDEIRRRTMPIANRYTIDEVLEACRYYVKRTGRRVIFEYALSEGVNASEADARELAGRLRGLQCHVNLIPLNTVRERELKGVREERVRCFLETLEKEHISCTRRREMGDDIEGACGQLRRSVLKQEESIHQQ